MASRGVVDEVGQRLRHRCAGVLLEEGVHLGGRPPRVQRAPHRRGTEAVDGGAAARLHVGEQREPPRDHGLQRPGRDRGEVGLQQHVVDRGRQQRVQPLGRVGAGRKPPAGSGQRSHGGDAEPPRLEQGAAHGAISQHGLPRPGPGHLCDHVVLGGDRRAGRERGQRVQRRRADRRRRTAFEVGGECVDRSVVLVPGADQRGRTRRTQPRVHEHRPPAGSGLRTPPVGGMGRQPRLVTLFVGAGREQSGGLGQLHQEAGLVVVDVEGGRERAHVADPDATRAQDRRRAVAPGLQYQLDAADQLEHRARPHLVHQVGPDVLGRHRRRFVDGCPGAVATAAQHADLVRQRHGACVGAEQQAAREQVLERPARGRQRDVVRHLAQPAAGRPVDEPVEQSYGVVARRSPGVLDPGGCPVGIGVGGSDPAGRRHRVARRLEPEIGGEHLQPGRRAAGQQRDQPGTETGRGRTDHVARGPHQPQVVVATPHQGERAQGRDDRPDRLGPRVHHPVEIGQGERLLATGQHLEHREVRGVQPVDRDPDRPAPAGARRELPDVGGCRT